MMVCAEGEEFPPGAQMKGFLRSTEKEERGERKCRCGQLAGGGSGLRRAGLEGPPARRVEGGGARPPGPGLAGQSSGARPTAIQLRYRGRGVRIVSLGTRIPHLESTPSSRSPYLPVFFS